MKGVEGVEGGWCHNEKLTAAQHEKRGGGNTVVTSRPRPIFNSFLDVFIIRK